MSVCVCVCRYVCVCVEKPCGDSEGQGVYILQCIDFKFSKTPLFPPFFLRVPQCQSSALVQRPQTSTWKYWSLKSTWSVRRQTNRARDGRHAVITKSMRLAEMMLTYQSCTLLSEDVSYGPISPRDRLEAFGAHVVLLVHTEY